MGRAVCGLLVALHFLCPLLFFTDLTRNPYWTQIVLLNLLVLAAAGLTLAQQSAEDSAWSLPRTPLDWPIASWVGLCLLTLGLSYFGHAPFYRPSILSEGTRVMTFTLVNAVLPFYLAARWARDCPAEPGVATWRWAAFALVWGLLWTAFPQMRATGGPPAATLSHLWDPYGGLLWAGGLGVVLFLARGADAHAFWHVALTAGFLGAAYGVAQYFSLEFLWPKVLNPYGGRSVSTFGNPNFMSSYLVILLPLAATYYLAAATRAKRAAYAVVLLVFEAGLLSSLTRSSWAGAVAALAPLALSPRLRSAFRADLEFHGLVVCAAAAMALFWPQSNVGGYASSVFSRLGEVGLIFTEDHPYSPWFQRVLIWTCAWQMGAENPLLGKGWGLFELFYPFYQGNLLDLFDAYRSLRTHANNAHNEVLEVWAQTGILGVGVVAWTWTSFSRAVWGHWSRLRRDPREPVWALAAAAGVLGMLVDNLLNVSLHFAVPAFLFWWQAGAAMGQAGAGEGWRRRVPFPGRGAALAAALAACAACAWGAWGWVGQWNREVRYFMGFKLMRREQFAAAVEELLAAHRWHSREVNTNYELGNAYARAEQFERAVWAYREALSANAGYDEIYFNLATVRARAPAGREEARKNFRLSWAINPLSQALYASYGAFLLADPAANRTEAVELLERATHFFPDDLNFLNNLGYLYSLGKDFEKAERLYVRALELKPDMAMAERNLRTLLTQAKRPEPEVLRRIDSYRRLEERIRARDFGAESLRLGRDVAAAFPRETRARFLLANLELANGDRGSAEKSFEWVLAREPANPNALFNLAMLRRAQGRIPEARDLLRRALQADPGNARLQQELSALP